MARFNDPRLRRTLNQLGQNIESANEQAQVGLYTFSTKYIDPCLSGAVNCLRQCAEPYLGLEDGRRRRQRGRSRGRLEHSFDFYDDWDEEEQDLLGWGNDELEHLLAAQSGTQPGRERGMSYGTRRERPRRKSAVQPHDGADPTVLPQSSYFGFLDRWPWTLSKGIRYKPSAADLRDHPSTLKGTVAEEQPLIEESDEDGGQFIRKKHKRNRSGTTTSGHTTDSLSSRGDIFPSEDELDDAVPIDDEFAMELERRTTGHADESSSGKTRSHKGSRLSQGTTSSKSTRDLVRTRSDQKVHEYTSTEPPTLTELQAEEDALHKVEEDVLERKRHAAQRLALQRGLSSPGTVSRPGSLRTSSPPAPATELSSASVSVTGVVPFPEFDPARSSGGASPAGGHIDTKAADGDSEPEPRHRDDAMQRTSTPEDSHFVPAALPRFSSGPS